MSVYINNEEQIVDALQVQKCNINEITTILESNPGLKRMIRLYSLYKEWWSQSIINKLKILIKILLRPFGINKSVHYSEKFCYLENYKQSCMDLSYNTDHIINLFHSTVQDNYRVSCNKLLKVIEYNKQRGRKTVCIMAPIFTKERLKDGYYRRIKAVDDIIGKNYLKIYMSSMDCSPLCEFEPKVEFVDDDHIRLDYHPWIEKDREYINLIADLCDVVYHHGVGFMDEDIIRKKHILKIVDLHGALPEEFALSSNYVMVQKENLHEELAMKYADYIICVTESMKNHMRNKYPQYEKKYIIMPILDKETLMSRINCKKKPDNINPIITYAGGTQKWQLIEKMQESMSKQPKYDYRIFVPDPKQFWKSWKKNYNVQNIKVVSASPSMLREEYNECQYGFVLRENIVVNNVACPTKLIEYLLKGIIPILDSTEIGDFVKDGMQYLSLDDFCHGKLPDYKTRIQMAQENQTIIDKIIKKYESGRNEISNILNY